MKKILVLVMVLLLSGCGNTGAEKYWDYDNQKSLEDKIENWITSYSEEQKSIDLILDRLDTIDKQIHDLDDFGVEEIQQDIETLISILEFDRADYMWYIDDICDYAFNGGLESALEDGVTFDYDRDTHTFCYYVDGELEDCETIEEDMG